MEYVKFGNTGMIVSRMCLGAMTFGPPKLDAEASRRVVDEALDQGVNFIDTAESYNESEELLGRILAGRREKVHLCTKVFRKRARDGKCGRNSRVNMIESLNQSLAKLQTDYVDAYLLHHPDPETPIEETTEALERMIRQGKVRYVGVSNHYSWQMAYMLGVQRLHGRQPIITIQCRWSLLDRAVERETIPFVRKFHLATMIYSPLAEGLLSGKYQRDTEPPEGSRGSRHKILKRYLEDDQTFDTIEALQEVANEQGVSLPQLAMLWLLGKDEATCPLLGGSKPEHFSLMYEIADRRLDDEVMQKLDEITEPWKWRRFINQPFSDGPAVTPQ